MPRNIGKIFEDDFKKSTPDYALLYRISDSAQSFGTSNNLRFSIKNPFDYILWDSNKHLLYALELKSVKGKSISFERVKEDKGEIHYHQIKGLNYWNEYSGIIAGLIIEFRELEKTVFIHIAQMNMILETIPKKSFNYADLDKYQIQYNIIPQQQIRTRYRYDVDGFLNN